MTMSIIEEVVIYIVCHIIEIQSIIDSKIIKIFNIPEFSAYLPRLRPSMNTTFQNKDNNRFKIMLRNINPFLIIAI